MQEDESDTKTIQDVAKGATQFHWARTQSHQRRSALCGVPSVLRIHNCVVAFDWDKPRVRIISTQGSTSISRNFFFSECLLFYSGDVSLSPSQFLLSFFWHLLLNVHNYWWSRSQGNFYHWITSHNPFFNILVLLLRERNMEFFIKNQMWTLTYSSQ